MRLAGGALDSGARPGPAVVGTAMGLSVAVGLAAAVEPKLTLLAALLAVAVAMVVAWPEAATLLVVFLLWANIPGVLINEHGAPRALGAAVPILLAIPVASRLVRGEGLRANRTFAVAVVLLIVEIVSTLFADHQRTAATNVQGLVIEGLLIYFLVINAVRTPQTLRRVLWTVLLAAAFLSSVTAVQKVLGNYSAPYFGFGGIQETYFLGKSDTPRAQGPIGDPNYYAQILLVAVPIGLLTYWRERSPLLRATALGASGLIILAIMLTFSRGAGLALVIVFVLMAFLRYVRPPHILAAIVAVMALLAFVPGYQQRVASVSGLGGAAASAGSEDSADVATRGRATEMVAGLMVFIDHPVFGVGPGGFPFLYQEYAQRLGIGEVHDSVTGGARAGEEAQRQTHNAYIGIAADLGLPGLAVFCTLLGVTLRDLVRARRATLRSHPELANMATALMLGVVSYAVTAMFLTLAFERYFWLLLGLAGAASMMAARAAESSRPGDPR